MQCLLSVNDCLTVGSIQINVLEVRHDCVKLGISDPNASPAYREEVLYSRSEDDETDDGDDTEAVYKPFEVEVFSPFAIPVL